MVNARMNPKHRSRIKNENPLLQYTKARGFLSSASSLGRGSFSDDKDFDKTCPDDSAIIRTYFPTRRWADAHWGYLRRADDACTGTERKRKALIRGYSNQGCAHDRSARFALQGVRRSRPRWELALFDKSRTIERRISVSNYFLDLGMRELRRHLLHVLRV